jgi:hypothetical protein
MNVRISQLITFPAGAWYDGSLEINHYTIKLWMITQSTNEEDQGIAFRRMKHFVCYELDSTIFIDAGEKEKCAELAQVGLNVTTLPGIPADQLIGIMLYHKLNAIMEGRIDVVEVEISAGDGVIYLHGENETSDDIQQPDWWSSPDVVHSDVLSKTENVVNMLPLNTWRDLNLAWPESPNAVDTGNTIVFADFKSSNDTE